MDQPRVAAFVIAGRPYLYTQLFSRHRRPQGSPRTATVNRSERSQERPLPCVWISSKDVCKEIIICTKRRHLLSVLSEHPSHHQRLIAACSTSRCPQLVHLRHSLLEFFVLAFLVGMPLGL